MIAVSFLEAFESSCVLRDSFLLKIQFRFISKPSNSIVGSSFYLELNL